MTKTVLTTCTRDCPCSCSLIAQVVDGRLVHLSGNSDHPVTRGTVCRKAPSFIRRLYSPERVLTPLRRTNTGWQRLGWDEALDAVADRLQRYCATDGSLAVLHYQRWGNLNALKLLNYRFFNLLGGATTNTGALCNGAGVAGQIADFGAYQSHSPEDILNSRFVFLWGRNPYTSNISQVRFIKEARERGARVTLVDPIPTASNRLSDRHLQLRPGSDGFLALALAKVLLAEHLIDRDFLAERTQAFGEFSRIADSYTLEQLAQLCDIPASVITEVAREYGKSRPASIWLGGGPQRWSHGAASFRLIDALGALSGNVGVPGGGVSYMLDPFGHLDPSVFGQDSAKKSRGIPMPLIGKGLLESENPPIKMIMTFGGNPVNQSPNSQKVKKAFEKVDFVVVVDQFLNDTAEEADLFLPATSFLEEEGLMFSYSHRWTGPVNPVVGRQGEVRTDLEILQGLADRLGVGQEMNGSPRYWLEKLTRPLTRGNLSIDELLAAPQLLTQIPAVPYEDGVFPTPSGRFQFAEEVPIQVTSDSAYPLHFLCIHAPTWTNSQVPANHMDELPEAYVHPNTALGAGLAHGMEATLRSKIGGLKVRLEVDARQREDTVLLYQGRWMKAGGGANTLTPDVMSHQGDSATYYETMVRLEL